MHFEQVVARVSGPEPGYVATPIFLVESAKCGENTLLFTCISPSLTRSLHFFLPLSCSFFSFLYFQLVLEEQDKIPRGVLTTASAFLKTSLINRLKARLY